jgi:MoaA/NifB/PqqE/SkfB family radical SAM enzyme
MKMQGQGLHHISDTFKKPFSFNIDIVDACNLRCVHCPRGVYYQKSTSKRMAVAVFNRLLDKIMAQCKCQKVDLYNWSEPFLHPELDQFVSVVRSKNIACGLSSNLSLKNRDRLEAVLQHSPALIVSVSGFTQAVHERYHKGSNVETVKDNLKFIDKLRETRGLSVHVRIHCLQFIDNQEDQLLWEQFCGDYGFVYQGTPAYCSEVTTPETAERLLFKPGFCRDDKGELKVYMNFSETPIFDACPLHNTIPINADGDVYLCCIFWNRAEYRIGNFFETSLEHLQERRLLHRHCSHCTVFRKH